MEENREWVKYKNKTVGRQIAQVSLEKKNITYRRKVLLFTFKLLKDEKVKIMK